MYCSSDCVISSGTFGRSLNEERCSVLDSSKIDAVLGLFVDNSSSVGEVGFGKDGDLGFSELKIEEKTQTPVVELNLDEWVGPSNSIEGYVPRRERNSKPLDSKSSKPLDSKSSKRGILVRTFHIRVLNFCDFDIAIHLYAL